MAAPALSAGGVEALVMEQTHYKVLLVEDERFYRRAFMRFVEEQQLPYDCTQACSAVEAKDILASERFDIIVSDYQLGDGTALDVLEVADGIPVIIVTGAGDEEVAVSAWRAGAYDYLTKDIDRNYLKAIPITVDNAIRHKKAEDRLNLLSAAVTSAGDSVIITDLHDRIVFVNRAFCNTYGYTEQEVLGRESSLITMDGPLSDSWEHLYQPFGGGELMAYHVRKDGCKFPVSLSVSLVKDPEGRATAYVGVARDISERLRTEYELESINLKLTTGNRVVI